MIQLPGEVSQQKVQTKLTFRQLFLKIPFSVRRYIILPVLCIIVLFITGAVLKLAWKFGEQLYQGVQGKDGFLNNPPSGIFIFLGLGILWFLVRKKYIRVSGFRMFLLILAILGWFGWKLSTFLYHGVQAELTVGRTILYAVFILLPLCAGIFTWSAFMRKYGGTWYDEVKNRWWWRENEFYILVGIVALHLDIFTVWPEWWTIHVWNDPRILWLHALLLVFALLIPRGVIPYHHKLGRIGVVVVIASMLFIFIWKPNQDPNDLKLAEEIERAKATAIASVPLPPGADPEVVVLARNKFRNYPFLFAVAIRESGLRQYEVINGEKHLLLAKLENGEKGTAAGIMQIKSDLHSEFCREKGKDLPSKADITTPEGNLDCALLIYHDRSPGRGPDAWYPEKGGIIEFDVVAVKNSWTEPLLLPKARFNYAFGNFVEERDDNSPTPYSISGPGIRREILKPVSITEFRVPEKATYSTATIIVSYNYAPILSAKN